MSRAIFSFPAQLRLSEPGEYKRVFANSVKSVDKYFTILGAKNKFNNPRLGLVIAKKNVKRAVDRNKIKRTVRENFRLQQYQLQNIDIVVLAKRDAAKVPLHVLRHSLERHWIKLVERCGSYS